MYIKLQGQERVVSCNDISMVRAKNKYGTTDIHIREKQKDLYIVLGEYISERLGKEVFEDLKKAIGEGKHVFKML